jgi:hypothetical protein
LAFVKISGQGKICPTFAKAGCVRVRRPLSSNEREN